MYQAFYNLKDQPFRLTPDPAFVCMTVNHREALAGLVYSVCTRPGLTVLTGEAGTGKTTILYMLLDMLQKRRFITALCTNPVLSREELFDFLIQKFGINCPSSLKSRQLSALQDTLLRNRADGRPSVLIVDEAHRLSSELLEEIRLLLNLETPREKLLQIIIAGQPELSEILRQPMLRQFKQRVSCHCKLVPLSFNQLKEYIDHRLAQAGLPRQTLFSEAVMQRIYEYSGGLPRLVNSVCDAALQTAFAIRSRMVTLAVIDEVARDLDLDGTTRPEQVDVSEALLSSVTARSSNGHVTDTFETNGNADMAMPLESYSARQKTVSFFGNLMDRWK